MESVDDFVRLIAPLERRMFETVWRVLRHPHDAEDALQSALQTLWRQRHRLASHPNPQALVSKVCADAALDEFRRRRRRQESVTPFEDGLVTGRPDPADEAVRRERADCVMAAVARLSRNQATAIIMRFIQGESDEAIAAALGCGKATVREHLARGRERLSRLLIRLAPPQGASRGDSLEQSCFEKDER